MKRTWLSIICLFLFAGIAHSSDIIRKCKSGEQLSKVYLWEDVKGLTPALIANTFVTQGEVEHEAEPLLRYWILMEPSSVPVDKRVAQWNASDADKSAVLAKADKVRAIRQLYRTIEKHESARLTPEKAAGILAAGAAKSDGITQEEYERKFLQTGPRLRQEPARAALRCSALRGAGDAKRAGSGARRLETSRQYVFAGRADARWDTWLRKNVAGPEIDSLLKLPEGRGMWGDFLVYRMHAIGCAAAAIPTDKDKLPPTLAGSVFMKSCVATPLHANQCECLAEVAGKALPDIRDHAYLRSKTIPSLRERNPLLRPVLATECNIDSESY